MAGTAGLLNDRNFQWGNIPGVLDEFIPDNSYPTGGYAVTGQLWGLAASGNPGPLSNNGIRGILQVGGNTAAAGYILYYNSQTGKLQVLAGGGGAPTGTIVSTSTAPTITTGTNAGTTAPLYVNGGALTQTAGAIGITGVQAPTITSTFTGTGGGGAAAEVANGTDLSALIFDVLVLAAGE